MSFINTSDLSRFGYRELEIASKLLKNYLENPQILGDGVELMFNTHSGCVYLTDDDYSVAMLNGQRLEKFRWCSNCGFEGFAEEFRKHQDDGKLQCPSCDGEKGEIYK